MSVKIGISPSLRHFTNNMAVVEVNGSTIGECLVNLVKKCPSIRNKLLTRNGKLFGPVGIYVYRDQNITRELDKSVEDSEELCFIVVMGDL